MMTLSDFVLYRHRHQTFSAVDSCGFRFQLFDHDVGHFVSTHVSLQSLQSLQPHFQKFPNLVIILCRFLMFNPHPADDITPRTIFCSSLYKHPPRPGCGASGAALAHERMAVLAERSETMENSTDQWGRF